MSPPLRLVVNKQTATKKQPKRDKSFPRRRVPNVIPFPHDPNPDWAHIEAPRGYFIPKEKLFLTEITELLAVSVSSPRVFDYIYELWSHNHQMMKSEVKFDLHKENS